MRELDNFAFSPATLEVPVGATVEWINNDDIPHKVVADDHTTFSSEALRGRRDPAGARLGAGGSGPGSAPPRGGLSGVTVVG